MTPERKEEIREAMIEQGNAMRPGRGWRHYSITFAQTEEEANYVAQLFSGIANTVVKGLTVEINLR